MTDFQEKILAYLRTKGRHCSCTTWDIAQSVFPEKWRRPQGRGALVGHIDRAAKKLKPLVGRLAPKDQWGHAKFFIQYSNSQE